MMPTRAQDAGFVFRYTQVGGWVDGSALLPRAVWPMLCLLRPACSVCCACCAHAVLDACLLMHPTTTVCVLPTGYLAACRCRWETRCAMCYGREAPGVVVLAAVVAPGAPGRLAPTLFFLRVRLCPPRTLLFLWITHFIAERRLLHAQAGRAGQGRAGEGPKQQCSAGQAGPGKGWGFWGVDGRGK